MYVITTNKDLATQAKHDYKKIYSETIIFQCADAYIITANRGKRGLVKNFGENAVFVFGTIFNTDHFNEELLESYNAFEDFRADLKKDNQLFFGHYVIILANSDTIEVIADRVGLINTYYSQTKNNDIIISDDLLEVCRLSGSNELCAQTVYEFLLTESNVGRHTIFENVFRLGFGRQIILKNGELEEKNIYHYAIEKLSTEEYSKRIERYFACFCNYTGKITADLSAGHDTRTITAIAHKTINQFSGFTHARQDDGGCDGQISEIIAEKLRIPFYYVDYSEEREPDEIDALEVLRETVLQRDAKRSQRWPILFTKKYGGCDLALGGLGGEVLRGKYNDFKNIEDFTAVYYRGNEAEKVCGFKNYSENVQNELKQYRLPQGMNRELLPNWYYAVAKMRIWGSGCIHHALLYGDVIHPLMDWYLMNPIFGFEKTELQDAKLQMQLIELFAPELTGIPINGVQSGKHMNWGNALKVYVSCLPKVRAIGTILRCRTRNKKEKAQLSVPENIPQELMGVFAVPLQELLTSKGKSVASRMRTILMAYDYIQS